MNSRNLARGIAIAVLVIAASVAIGLGAYNAGVAHGIVESGRAVAAVPPGATPYIRTSNPPVNRRKTRWREWLLKATPAQR